MLQSPNITAFLCYEKDWCYIGIQHTIISDIHLFVSNNYNVLILFICSKSVVKAVLRNASVVLVITLTILL